jgi:16S rRNA (guanine966-N2)-methyltransferase
LFNSIQATTPGARVLDLFAGSGALGFEALSRGAAEVVFAESGVAQRKLLERNAAALGVAGQVRIIGEPLLSAAALARISAQAASSGPFDLVLADPPYAEGWELQLLERCPWETWLSDAGLFCLEWGALKSRVAELPGRSGFLEKVRERSYGDSMLTTFRKSSLPIPGSA